MSIPRRAHRHMWVTGTLMLAFAGCNSASDPLACTEIFVYGLTVHTVDAATGLPVSDGLSGTLKDGSYTESMMALESDLVGAGERAGTYDVSVAATGFSEWTTTGVVITADECHVIPVSLEARLQASG